MNVNHVTMEGWLRPKFESLQGMYERVMGTAETMVVTKTLQWDDYSKYVTDEAEKKQSRREKFPVDLEATYQLGIRLVS